MPNRVYESMTRVKVGGYVVRVWKSEGGLTSGGNKEVMRVVKGCDTPKEISEALDKLPDIAAYEILDASGNGCIVYPDWS